MSKPVSNSATLQGIFLMYGIGIFSLSWIAYDLIKGQEPTLFIMIIVFAIIGVFGIGINLHISYNQKSHLPN